MPRIHREDVERYPGTLTQLAIEVSDLRYDALAAFLHALASKLDEDGRADAGRSRPKLSTALHAASAAVKAAATDVEVAWSICAPRMEVTPEP